MTWQSHQAHNTPKQIRRILRRDKGICYVCGKAGATEVDHIIPLCEGGDDTDANRAAIHKVPCHQAKTQAEALRHNPRAQSRKRQEEQHPGVMGGG